MSTLREAAEKALKALDVATTPLAKDRQEVLSAMAALRAELAKPDARPAPAEPQGAEAPQEIKSLRDRIIEGELELDGTHPPTLMFLMAEHWKAVATEHYAKAKDYDRLKHELRLSRTAPAPQPAGGERAWLVGSKVLGHRPQWWGFNREPRKHASWCSDANDAIRFSRKEDAERMRLHIIAVAGLTGRHDYERTISAIEHQWCLSQGGQPGGEREAPADILTRLRNTPNWMRESYGSWKDCVLKYDRAPFEAAEEIERLRADLSQPTAQQERKPLTDEQCEQVIRLAGLWTLAAAVPTNRALLIGLCRAAHGITATKGGDER